MAPAHHFGAMEDPSAHVRGTTRTRTSAADFCFAPRTMKHFRVDGDQAIDLLEPVVEQMLAGTAPFRDLMLVGPVGSGKRTLARAVAREFGGNVLEAEPPDLTSPDAACDALRRLRDGDAFVVHNIDEFRPNVGSVMIRAMVHRSIAVPEEGRGTHFLDPSLPHVYRVANNVRERIAEGSVFILTTNEERCMPAVIAQRAFVFSLRRSAAGSAGAMARALRGHGITCSDAAAAEFGGMLVAATGDPFAAAVALVVGQARRRGFTHVDEPLAVELAGACWRLIPMGSLQSSIANACARWACDRDEAVRRLRVPADLASDAESARPVMIPRPEEREDEEE